MYYTYRANRINNIDVNPRKHTYLGGYSSVFNNLAPRKTRILLKTMKKTPENISKARQQAGEQAKIWRAAIAAARAEPILSPAKHTEVAHRVAYAQAQIAEIARELKKLRKQGKKPFWR